MTDHLDRLKAALSDRYAIEREIGRGGMATVYLGEDLKHHRSVAVKVLRPELAATIGVERFLREIEIAANLTHPHILPLFDSGEADGFLYYVMPYIEGESLRDRLFRERQLAMEGAVGITREVASALAYAHDQGVVHRDIKPENIMLSTGGAVVADFGIARAVAVAGSEQLTEAGMAVGTPAYMSPEQATAEAVDGRSDTYSLGCVMYEMLAGDAPYSASTPQAVIAKKLSEPLPRISVVRETVPPSLEFVIAKAMARNPVDRFATPLELMAALSQPSGDSLKGETADPDDRSHGPRKGVGADEQKASLPDSESGRRLRILAIGALAVFVAAVGAVLLSRSSRVTLDSDHVVVAVFRNATGDPSFDLLGERAAHWVTQGVQQAAIPVSPWDAAYKARAYVQTEMAEGRARSPVQALAEETGAGTVISGAIYKLEAGRIEIVVSVTDAKRQRLIGTLDPVSSAADSVTHLLGDLRQRVMGFLAMRSDEQRAAPFDLAGAPPTFEAYSALRAGMDYFVRAEMAPAQPHFRRAVELDSTFAEALLFLAITLRNMHEYRSADSVLDAAQRHERLLTPYYRSHMEFLRALIDGDLEQTRFSIRRAADMAPRSRASFAYAATCYWTNRPAETVQVLETLDPERGAMRDWVGYSGFLTEALFMVGEHERELEAALRARRLYPENLPWTLAREAVALAAMGRVEEVGDVLSTLFSVLDSVVTAPVIERSRQAAVEVVEVLRNAGHVAAAREILSLVIQRFETRPPSVATSLHHRLWYGRALYLAGRYDEARRVLDALVVEFPADVPVRGTRAFVAAAGGDSMQATLDARWLEELDRPYLFGENTYWRGVIAAWLGDPDDAVTLLLRAHEQGRRYHWYDFVSTDLEPLRDYGRFQQWMRPKG
jgi:serine/threonine protein kinase/tetratricopeptide (TPR) repeat protein